MLISLVVSLGLNARLPPGNRQCKSGIPVQVTIPSADGRKSFFHSFAFRNVLGHRHELLGVILPRMGIDEVPQHVFLVNCRKLAQLRSAEVV
jgi:hypothetical protein